MNSLASLPIDFSALDFKELFTASSIITSIVLIATVIVTTVVTRIARQALDQATLAR